MLLRLCSPGSKVYKALCQIYVHGRIVRTDDFVVDTGASVTCMPALNLAPNLKEEFFIDKKVPNTYMNGVLNRTGEDALPDVFSVKFYQAVLERFQIGSTIALTDFPIWITFDERFNASLIGQDALELVHYQHIGESRSLLLSTDIEDLREALR